MRVLKGHAIQVALNSSMETASFIIGSLPVSPRVILEAGTPFIKTYGASGIARIYALWRMRIVSARESFVPYIVADMKCMDRGETEVAIAAGAGATAVTALGSAPAETLNAFIAACRSYRVDSIIDMMNVDKPYAVMRKLSLLPDVVLLHRGVDEERDSDKLLPIHMINKIKGTYDVRIAIAGGDTPREVQAAVFNGADIVVLWKDFYQDGGAGIEAVEHFLANVK